MGAVDQWNTIEKGLDPKWHDARLDFVPRPGLNNDVERDEVRVIGGNGDDAQPVGQVIREILVREYFARRIVG